MKQRVFSFLLAAALAVTMTLRPVTTAHAMGAEGVIIGGAVSGPVLAGVSLTAPQIALLVAAGFGLVFAVEHADEIADGMSSALETAAAGVASGAEQLSRWWENAAKGAIALAGAPAWIISAIKSWVGDFYSNTGSVATTPGMLELGVTQTAAVDFWSTAAGYEFQYPADCFRLATWDYSEDGYFNYTIKLFVQSADNHSLKWRRVGSSSWTSASNFFVVLSQSGSVSPENKTEYDLAAKAAAMSLPFVEKTAKCCEDAATHPHSTDGTFSKPTKAYIACLVGSLGASAGSGSICPDATVGGIGQALDDGHSIDNVKVPDMSIAGSGSICPDGVLDGSLTLDDTVADVITGLTDGTLTWTDYVADVGVGTPTISIPQEGTGTGALDYPITDTGVSDVPIEETQPGTGTTTPPPEGLAPYTLDLRDFFPFCIPFDIYEFFDILCAEPEAPVFDLGLMNPVTGEMETYTVDLSVFDPVAEILRGMELLLFCVGLAFATRKLIGG